jgi:hypothetical protein
MRYIKVILPPLKTLREVFSIDPNNGRLILRVPRRNRVAGQEAGYTNNIGYRQVSLCGKIYSVHRIAWAFYYGEEPSGEIDHINGNRADNRLCNLRLATSAQNNQNRRLSSRNKTGIKCVFRVKWRDSWRWRVSVGFGGGEHVIKHFICLGQAAKHANRLRAQLHDEFANPGKLVA